MSESRPNLSDLVVGTRSVMWVHVIRIVRVRQRYSERRSAVLVIAPAMEIPSRDLNKYEVCKVSKVCGYL